MLSYISLFSSAGIGCFGFKIEGFDCVVTNELIPRRLDIQRYNRKCKYDSGYIEGDITNRAVYDTIIEEINNWKKREKKSDIDVLIATPPCQGMSIANHKKTEHEILRNSLVTESIKLIDKIKPRFFIFENVPAFLRTICTDIDGQDRIISDVIQNRLSKDYSVYGKVINFKDYGACSSRSRTLVIGVRSDFADDISPLELFPDVSPERTLREVIGHLPSLKEIGEITPNDIYHTFRPYPQDMRKWISCLSEGMSAFENEDPLCRPHHVVDGEIIPNQQKNGDKYRRQFWDKVGPCVHTRNDQLASQNTIHPSDDRVFSIRELMLMMTIPMDFQWSSYSNSELNSMSEAEKRKYLKKAAVNIRQSIGEAVPTAIFQSIARKIKNHLKKKVLNKKEIHETISSNELTNIDRLVSFIEHNSNDYSLSTLSRIAELANLNRTNNAAYFTNKVLASEVVSKLPDFPGRSIRILEPSVGVGNFLPLIFKKYEDSKHVQLDVVDIDSGVLLVLKALLRHMLIPHNFSINLICADFLTKTFNGKYDLIVGNPPFSKLTTRNELCKKYLEQVKNKKTTNTFAFFIEKALSLSTYTALISPKYLLNTAEFAITRKLLSSTSIDFILDFGEKGFDGVLVETVCIGTNSSVRPNQTTVKSITKNIEIIQQQDYITDTKFPYWIIYRDSFFDSIANKFIFNVFNVFRDRQITNSDLSSSGDIRVLKSRNISNDGTTIIDIDGYDAYIQEDSIRHLAVYNFLNSDNVYLVPNMTYYPRMMKKPKGCVVNGSVAILIPKNKNLSLTQADMLYYSSDEYRKFYSIARNFQTRSLNIDSTSVFFFGLNMEDHYELDFTD